VVAVLALQGDELSLVLDALGEGLDVQRTAKLDERVDERRDRPDETVVPLSFYPLFELICKTGSLG
jgi:hypothetical protein